MANAGVRGRPIAPLVLSGQEREYLERQVRRHRVARSRDAASFCDVRTAWRFCHKAQKTLCGELWIHVTRRSWQKSI
jgi:hypothetical protein